MNSEFSKRQHESSRKRVPDTTARRGMKPSNRRDFPSFLRSVGCPVRRLRACFPFRIFGPGTGSEVRKVLRGGSGRLFRVFRFRRGNCSMLSPAALGRSSGPIACSSLQAVCAVVARVAPLVGGACDSSVFSVRSDGGAWRRFAENENAERFPVRKRPAFRSSFRSRRAINIGPAAFSDSLSPSRCFRCA